MWCLREAIELLASRLRLVRQGGECHVLRRWSTTNLLCSHVVTSAPLQVLSVPPEGVPLCDSCMNRFFRDRKNRRNRPPPTGPVSRKMMIRRPKGIYPVKPLAGQLDLFETRLGANESK